MTITHRRSAERGHSQFGWLDSRHSFSFGSYFDPRHMGFENLRVLNDDWVQGGAGFGKHGHREMEIISYVLEGALEHRDSMGERGVLKAFDVQRMSAGTGVMHSEFNGSADRPVHFLQIWVMPRSAGVRPSYLQRSFADMRRVGEVTWLVTSEGRAGSLEVNADVALGTVLLEPSTTLVHPVPRGHAVYVHVASGRAKVAGEHLEEGDAVALRDVTEVVFEGDEGNAEVLVFELPATS